jgi:predicted RNA methylase
MTKIVATAQRSAHLVMILHLTPSVATAKALQNAAGFGCNHGLHHQLATAIQDGYHNRFLVHVNADILDVATHLVASLRERSFASTGTFPQGNVPFSS